MTELRLQPIFIKNSYILFPTDLQNGKLYTIGGGFICLPLPKGWSHSDEQYRELEDFVKKYHAKYYAPHLPELESLEDMYKV